jgi:hypothetical protein
MHGHAFGEFDTGLGGRIEQIEKDRLLGVVGLGRIARGGADAAIAFFDEVFVGEVLGLLVTPGDTSFLVQIFGKGFGKTVGEGFDDDGAERIVRFLELMREVVRTVNADGKSADEVGAAASLSARCSRSGRSSACPS